MKTTTISFLLILLALKTFSQISPDKYFVRFTDKNNSPYSIDDPTEFLSQRSIDRRLNQGINLNESDLPVNPSYLDGIAQTGAMILNPSKWLNGVSVFTDDPAVIAAIYALPYVLSITESPVTWLEGNEFKTDMEKPFFKHEAGLEAPVPEVRQGYEMGVFDYGMGLNQIQMLNGDVIHQMGYRGQGMVIAVLDAGFLNANSHSAFDSLWQNDQILGTRDFVAGGQVQYDGHFHGSMVLSCMGGNYPGQLIGTAPKASFWLLRSEDGASEYIIEEYNWVSAAEYADSVGADVINSSLGYTVFHDPTQDHTYADMNGDTTPATIGADMAAKKGILVVNSLGNDGAEDWYYLSAPSDGDSVLGIGAVDADGDYAGFSSHGPSYDGRVKPDVVAQGSYVYIADPNGGGFGYSGGTSFSSPILAGMAACLWQANPSMDNMQIANAIRQSGSRYITPDAMLGHGIPDFLLANDILTIVNDHDGQIASIAVYPNPSRDVFTVDISKPEGTEAGIEEGIVEITDITGRVIGSQKISSADSKIKITLLQNAPKGIYYARVELFGNQWVGKLVKN